MHRRRQLGEVSLDKGCPKEGLRVRYVGRNTGNAQNGDVGQVVRAPWSTPLRGSIIKPTCDRHMHVSRCRTPGLIYVRLDGGAGISAFCTYDVEREGRRGPSKQSTLFGCAARRRKRK